MSDYKKLDVWEYAHALVLNVHGAAKEIRGAEVLSLKSQMTRAAMSIPTNLVEGCGQQSAREFGRFIKISLNSASELEYQLLLARDLDALREEAYRSLTDQTVRVRKMLYGLLKSLSRQPSKPPTTIDGPEPTTRNP
ncbi:MAG: four helix bundle protein [Gemmatimonadaceae bacterium]